MGTIELINRLKSGASKLLCAALLTAGAAHTQALEGIECQFNINNQWDTGAVADLVVANTSDYGKTLSSIIVTFGDGVSLVNSWGASVSGSNPYFFVPETWNAHLNSGASLSIGLQVTKPAGAVLNPLLEGDCTNDGLIAPTATFSIERRLSDINFDGSASSSADGSDLTYSWNFGDGSSITGAGPIISHSYATAGTYSVALTVTDGQGLSTTKTLGIAVYAVEDATPTDLTCDITGDLSVRCSTPQSFGDYYFWDWGDGVVQDHNNHLPSHIYANPGTYTVTVIVQDITGALTIGTAEVTVESNGITPQAAFETVQNGFKLAVDASSSIVADVAGNGASYRWDWGDDSFLVVGETADHVYGAPGVYDVTLEVIDDGLSGFATHSITVTVPEPVSGLSCQWVHESVSEFFVTSNLVVTNNTGAPISGLQITAAFDSDITFQTTVNLALYGDGPYVLVNDYLTIQPGEFQEFLMMTSPGDNGGSPAAIPTLGGMCDSVVPVNTRPNAAVSCSLDNPELPRYQRDTASCTGASSMDMDGDTLTYLWDFGDGTTATTVDASHTFSSSGRHNISLTVNDGELEDTATTSVFLVLDDFDCTVDGVDISCEVVGPGGGDYNWDFGDGSTATGTPVSHSYGANGDYEVSMEVSYDGSTALTFTKTYTVEANAVPNQPPVACFMQLAAPEPNNGVAPQLDASCSSDPNGDPLTYSWDFGTGDTGTGVMPSYEWPAPGSYTVTLTVSDGVESSSTSDTLVVPEAATPASCEYFIQSDWGAGFVAVIRITNTGTTAIDGWDIGWEYLHNSIPNGGWGATIIGNNPYYASDSGWNALIPPGGSVEIGFQGLTNGYPAEIPIVFGDVCGNGV